jgi:hypothetical protein
MTTNMPTSGENPPRPPLAKTEIAAMESISEALNSLGNHDAQARVMRWAVDRYELGEIEP